MLRVRNLVLAIAAIAILAAPALAVTTVYTDQASFLAAVDPGFYLEDFAAIGFGDPGGDPLAFTDGTYSYDLGTTDLSGLFSGGGNMSTNTAFTPLQATFTGAPVSAVGGNFWLTDFDFFDELGDITIALSDGTSETLTNATGSTFLGFTSDSAPIASITLSPVDPGDGVNRWSTVDNLHVGVMVPEPTSLSLIGLSLLGFLGLRRR